MTTTDVLRQAKELLSDERRWLRDGGFSDGDVGPQARNATRWCALGAVCRAGGQKAFYDDRVHHSQAVKALVAALGFRAYNNIFVWNDYEATHAELIDAFDRALLLVADPVEENVGEAVAA